MKQKTEDTEPESDDFTGRVLMSLVGDVALLNESVERVRVQVNALAEQHGIATAA